MMGRLVGTGCLLLAAVGACAAAHEAIPPKIVLIAGDGSLPVFDNAVGALASRLVSAGAAAGDIQRLSAATRGRMPHDAQPATLNRVLDDIAAMRPRAGQGCLVFATSHGVKGDGLYLSRRDEVLTPRALDRALLAGCGDAPTFVVMSSCFSGSFAQAPMTRDNRIVLTAARADRTSFGCHAGRSYTVFDQCLLAAIHRQDTWKQVYISVKSCVAAEEQRESVVPSEPQAWFGSAMADARLP